MLKRAQRIFIASQGIFDCTIANTLMKWHILPQHLRENILNSNHYNQSNLHLLSNYYIKFTAPIILDFGGIAKGFAVDIAILCLKNAGIKNALVNAGGDLRVLGNIAEEIYIRNPLQPKILHHVGDLADGAIATSAAYFSKTKFGSESVNALVNPETRHAISSEHSFSVIAPRAYLADALTKVVAISQNPQHHCLKLFSAHAVIL